MYTNKYIYKSFKELSKLSNSFLINNQYAYINRVKKTSILEGFAFKSYYTDKTMTQESVASRINEFNNTNYHRTSFSKRSNSLPDELFIDYYNYINEKINILFPKNIMPIQLISCDGTHSNSYNKSSKCGIIDSISMGFFNITYNEPSFLTQLNHKNERKGFISNLKNTENSDIKNIYVMDRGFQDKKMFAELATSDKLFVCRSRESVIFKGIDTDDIYVKNVRYVKYFINNIEYILATNISKDIMSINELKNIYARRWDVEEYFKFVKHNMKMDCFSQKKLDSIKTSIYANLIMSKIVYLIFNLYKHKCKVNQIINKAFLTSELYSTFLLKFVYNKKFSERFLIKFFKNSIKFSPTNKGKNICNPRTCKMPYKKWGKKQHTQKLVKDKKNEKKTNKNVGIT